VKKAKKAFATKKFFGWKTNCKQAKEKEKKGS
jgi:hypothetical protein